MRSLSLVAAVVLAGCGGGGGDVPAPAPTPDPNATRIAAATATATSTANACAAAQPFYWEIGNAAGRLAAASVASASDPTAYTATTSMNIASASKWLYSSYFVQRQAGVLNDDDVKFLTFRSGYTIFAICLP